MFAPLGQRIYVQDDIEKHEGILLKPPSQKDSLLFTSKVLAVGEDIVNPKIKVGDTIYRGQFAGLVLDEAKHLRILNLPDVWGVDR